MHFPSRFFSTEGDPGCVTAWCPNFLQSSTASAASTAASEAQQQQPFKETKPEAIPLTVMKLQTRAEASTASEAAATEAVILVAKIIPASASSPHPSLFKFAPCHKLLKWLINGSILNFAYV